MAPLEIASKPVARNGMEGGFRKRMYKSKRPLFLRKVKLKDASDYFVWWSRHAAR